MSTRILLADDHAMMREGLRAILAGQAGLEVVGEAENGRQAIELADRLCPDVVVMDVAMPGMNGVEATRRLRAANPKLKVIALSLYVEPQFVRAMLDAGAIAYVIKASASRELIEALKAAAKNRKYLSPAVAGEVLDDCAEGSADGAPTAFRVLSPRQREILQLIAEGHSSKVIADELKISQNTVEVHRRNLMRKLGMKSIADVTRYAVREGLASL